MKSGAILYRAHFSARLPENQDRRARPPVFAATGLSRAKLMVIRVFATERRNRQKDGGTRTGRSLNQCTGSGRGRPIWWGERENEGGREGMPTNLSSQTKGTGEVIGGKQVRRTSEEGGANANSNLNLPSSVAGRGRGRSVGDVVGTRRVPGGSGGLPAHFQIRSPSSI